MDQNNFFLVFGVIWVVVFLLIFLRNMIRRKSFNYDEAAEEMGLKAQAKVLEIEPYRTSMFDFNKTLKLKILVYPRHIPEFKTYLYINAKEKVRLNIKIGDMIDVAYSVTSKSVNLLSS